MTYTPPPNKFEYTARGTNSQNWTERVITSFQVRQLFNNPSHRKLLARLLVQDIEKIPTKYGEIWLDLRSDDLMAFINAGYALFALSRLRLSTSSRNLLANTSRWKHREINIVEEKYSILMICRYSICILWNISQVWRTRISILVMLFV